MRTLAKISTFLDSRRVSMVMWYVTLVIMAGLLCLEDVALWARILTAVVYPLAIDFQRRELNKLS